MRPHEPVPPQAIRLWSMQPKGRTSRKRSAVTVCDLHRHPYQWGVRLTTEDAAGRECAVCGATPGRADR